MVLRGLAWRLVVVGAISASPVSEVVHGAQNPDRGVAAPAAQRGLGDGAAQAAFSPGFAANSGQLPPAVRFVLRMPRYLALVGDTGVELCWGPEATEPGNGGRLSWWFEGAAGSEVAVGEPGRVGIASYYLGSDSARWRSGVPTYAAVRLRQVNPGVDVVLHERDGELEYSIEIAAGVALPRLRLRFAGADGLAINDVGDLVVSTPFGVVTHPRPVVYREVGEGSASLAAKFEVTSDASATVAILEAPKGQGVARVDPVATTSWVPSGVFSSFHKVVVDRDGTTYVCGAVAGGMPGPPQPDVFVARLSPDRVGLAAFVVIGGSEAETVVDLASDGQGMLTLVGSTSSADFPATAGAPSARGGGDFFVARFDMRAARMAWATAIGGTSLDQPAGVAQSGGSVMVTGRTVSIDFPVSADAFDTTCGTDGRCNESPVDNSRFADSFVASVAGADGSLRYATYLGGRYDDVPEDLIADDAGNVYVVGGTSSSDFPVTPGVYQETCGSGGQCNYPGGDAFLTRLPPDMRSLSFSTFLGGGGWESSAAVALEPGGGLTVVGFTSSSDFPLVRPMQATLGGSVDIFLARLDGDGRELLYSTYFGGTDDEQDPAWVRDQDLQLAVDESGRAILAFRTVSRTLPVASPLQPFQWSWNERVPPGDAYVVEIDTDSNTIPFATYLGGAAGDRPLGLALDGENAMIISGYTGSFDFFGAPLRPGIIPRGRPFLVSIERQRQLADLRVSFAPPAGVRAATLSPGLTVTATNDGPAAAVGTGLAVWLGGYQNPWMEVAASQGSCRTESAQVLCDLGTIPTGGHASVSVGFSGQTPPEAAVAAVRSLASDPATGNNSSNLGFADRPTADVVLAGPGPEVAAVLEQARVVELTVSNMGPATAPGVALIGRFPDVFVVTGATSTVGECAVSSSTVTCAIGELGAAASARVTITVRPTRTGAFDATVFVGGRLHDPGTDNDRWLATFTVSAPFPASFQRLVPAVAHNAGAGGALWRTDLAVVNPNSQAATVTLRPRTSPAVAAKTVTLTPMGAVDWRNVLESLFGVPPRRDVSGVVEIAADRSLAIAARTYNQGAAGTYGQEYPALKFNAEESTALLGLRKSSQFRTNVGYVNMGERQCALELTLFDADGQALGLTKQVALAPGEWRQEYDVFGQLAAGAQEQASGNSGGDWLDCASVWMYASVIDSRTGDPTTTTRGACSPCLFPSVAHLPGAGGTAWRTDITLANPSFGTPYVVELYYITGDEVLVREVELPGSTTREWRDVLVSLFGFAPEARTSGTLVVVPPYSISASSRTYNETASGTFGQQYPPLFPGEGLLAGQRGVIPQLRRNAEFRSNAGVVNTGGTSIDVSLRIYGADGAPLGTPVIVRVAPWRWKQVNDILGAASAGDRDVAWALVEILTPDGSAWAYGSLIDRRSGDPTTISMVVVEEP